MLTLTHAGKVGEADKYTLTDDGYEHRFIVSNVEKKVDGDEEQSAIRRAVERYKAAKAVANG